MSRRRLANRFLGWLGFGLLAYALLAYAVAPEFWWRLERGLAARPEMVTRTTADIPGDPINVGFVGRAEDVLDAFHAAGWHPADALTLKSAAEIGIDVLLDRPYADAPVSTLLFEGRPQDFAFEMPIGTSPDMRHHVRLWRLEQADHWLGAATLDRGVGFSHDTGQITHHIAPDIDAERALVLNDLAAAGMVSESYAIPGIGATTNGRNGGGDPYVTDGLATVIVLVDRD